jgi:hypothetical protein
MAGGQSRIYIHDEQDFEHAVQLMREIGAPAQRVSYPQPESKKHPVLLLAAIACVVIFSLGAIISK